MGIAKLNHIGIAIQTELDRSPMLQRLFEILEIKKGLTEAVPEQGVDVHFFELSGPPPHLEFLEVRDPQGPVAKFIEKRGQGIHHLSFEVSRGSLDSICDRLVREGFKLTYPQPKKGAQNMRINFVHPSTANGVLVEIMEAS